MAQIKIYALKTHLDPIKTQLSNLIHQCAMQTLQLPSEKRFHRFFPLQSDDFVFPSDRSERYIILEVSLFEGRTTETKKAFIKALFETLHRELQISPQDVEITLFETPRHNWGIRGQHGDEIGLNYRVEV